MRYLTLRHALSSNSLFRLEDLRPHGKAAAHEPLQLSRWVSQGMLVRLKKGLYALPHDENEQKLSPLWLANQLYFPSYISLEFVLSQVGLIPEAVSTVTSVTTRKTKTFSNPYGTFSYRKVSPEYFFGFKTFRLSGQSVYMALPEKAILDFVYLSIPKSVVINDRLLIENYRFQNLKQLNVRRIRDFAVRFAHPRVQNAAAVLLKMMGRHS